MARTKKFKTVEELEQLIDDYFKHCDSRIVDVVTKHGVEQINKPKPYSVEGLAAWLEIDRRSLLNYEKEKGYEIFFPTIEKAKQKILANLSERGLDGTNVPAMTIFNLKNNYGYKDKQEHELSGSVETNKPDLSKLSDDELRRLIEIQSKLNGTSSGTSET